MVGYQSCNLPRIITILEWKGALEACADVQRVEAKCDEHGISRKSIGGNHYAPYELEVYMRGVPGKHLTTGVTLHKGPFHAYMRAPPTLLEKWAKAVFQAAVRYINFGNVPPPPAPLALPPVAPPVPAPPVARALPAAIPPPPRSDAWEHYSWDEGHWHLHVASGYVVRSWTPMARLPPGWDVYHHNGRRWLTDGEEHFWLDPVHAEQVRDEEKPEDCEWF